MTPLDQVIQHIRAQGRVGTHGAVLLREIERLRVEVTELRLIAYGEEITQETINV